MTATIATHPVAYTLLALFSLYCCVWWAASVIRAHRARQTEIADLVLRLNEANETVEFTEAADEAIALTLPVVEPPVFDDMMRNLPLNEAIWLMPGALGDEVEAWLQEGAAS